MVPRNINSILITIFNWNEIVWLRFNAKLRILYNPILTNCCNYDSFCNSSLIFDRGDLSLLNLIKLSLKKKMITILIPLNNLSMNKGWTKVILECPFCSINIITETSRYTYIDLGENHSLFITSTFRNDLINSQNRKCSELDGRSNLAAYQNQAIINCE